MPLTVQEQDRRAALDALAAGHGVPLPLTAAQAEWLAELLPYLGGVPAGVHGGLIRYLLCGLRPGDFLAALLANDLIETIGRADDANTAALRAWGQLLYGGMPGHAWGSRDKREAWIVGGGVAGTRRAPPAGRAGEIAVGDAAATAVPA